MAEHSVAYYKKELLNKEQELEKSFNEDKESHLNNQEELSNASNHPGDEGTDLFDRQKDAALEHHSAEKLEEVKAALKAIEDGDYGLCRECGKTIPDERLEIKPETLYCVEHADSQARVQKRPVEEDVIAPLSQKEESYKETLRQDTWDQASEHGTSDSPSDHSGKSGK